MRGSSILDSKEVRGDDVPRSQKPASLEPQAGGFKFSGLILKPFERKQNGDTITVRSWVAELKSRRVTFAHEVQRAEDGQASSRGSAQGARGAGAVYFGCAQHKS